MFVAEKCMYISESVFVLNYMSWKDFKTNAPKVKYLGMFLLFKEAETMQHFFSFIEGRSQKDKRGSRGRGRRTSEEDTPKKKKLKGG